MTKPIKNFGETYTDFNMEVLYKRPENYSKEALVMQVPSESILTEHLL
eukprot:UN21341